MLDSTVDRHFELNKQDVNAEVIDGEAIIINVTTGVYYSLDSVGAYIWELLTTGASVAESVQALMNRYRISAEQASTDLSEIVSQLVEEGLVLETEPYGPSSVNGAASPGEADSYEKPLLNIYRDMGDLLALDPPTPGLTLTPWEMTAGPDASKLDE